MTVLQVYNMTSIHVHNIAVNDVSFYLSTIYQQETVTQEKEG